MPTAFPFSFSRRRPRKHLRTHPYGDEVVEVDEVMAEVDGVMAEVDGVLVEVGDLKLMIDRESVISGGRKLEISRP